MKIRQPPTFESEVLNVLAYEFPFSDKAEAERKIKQRLRRKKLGPYDAERIEILRRFKDELQQEIGKFDKSRFFTEFHGKYSDMRDFDIPRLTAEMVEHFPQIPKKEHFVPFCVFLVVGQFGINPSRFPKPICWIDPKLTHYRLSLLLALSFLPDRLLFKSKSLHHQTAS